MDWLKQGTVHHDAISENGLPPDAHVVAVRWDGIRGVVELAVESETFEPVDDMQEPPLLLPVISRDFLVLLSKNNQVSDSANA